MFVVDAQNYTIDLHRGDTGVLGITAETDYEFGPLDRAIFTLKDSNGKLIKKNVCEMTDNRFEITFVNSDTDGLMPGLYTWDVRYVVNPVYDSEGQIYDGLGGVYTPRDPMTLNLRTTVGQI